MSNDGIVPREWRDGDKRRIAYVGVAAHASAAGIGNFIVLAEDVAALEEVWNRIFFDRYALEPAKVKEAGLCSLAHINEMAGKDAK